MDEMDVAINRSLRDFVQWYALYLRSRFKKKAYAELLRKDIECFLPLIEEVRVWSDCKKKVEEPLFPGYVFVKTDLQDKEHILQMV